MGIKPGVDGGDFATHIDAANWTRWTGKPANIHEPASAPTADAAERKSA